MRNILFLTFCILLSVNGLAQESEVRNVGSFTALKVAEAIDAYLKKGDKESVRVEVSGTSLDNVITEVSGSYLKVHMKRGTYYRSVKVKVYITYTKLDKLSASSAASIFSEDVLNADELEISSSSAGNVKVKVNAGDVTASASSAGEIELQGTARSLMVSVSSAGECDAYDLEAQRVEAQASSGGSAKVRVTTSLRADASSGGSVRYIGNPSKSITNSSSGGSVRKSD